MRKNMHFKIKPTLKTKFTVRANRLQNLWVHLRKYLSACQGIYSLLQINLPRNITIANGWSGWNTGMLNSIAIGDIKLNNISLLKGFKSQTKRESTIRTNRSNIATKVITGLICFKILVVTISIIVTFFAIWFWTVLSKIVYVNL